MLSFLSFVCVISPHPAPNPLQADAHDAETRVTGGLPAELTPKQKEVQQILNGLEAVWTGRL